MSLARVAFSVSLVVPALVLFVGLIVYTAIQAPVPAVNEPHYLGKAKHFWDPAWCAGDFFLESSNPHLVFYVAVGGLTRLVSLEATAWIGRAAGYGLLAIGWTMLARRVAGAGWAALPSAAIFLLLGSFGNLSGEWLVGGIEGKVFAYALLFMAIAFWCDERRTAAAACLGAATSLHPIVGGWGLVCGAAAEVAARWRNGIRHDPARDRRAWLIPAGVFFIAALPGLIPAVSSLVGGDPQEAARATYLQVFVRLKHHLDPMQFGAARYAGYATMFGMWVILQRRSLSSSGEGSGVRGAGGGNVLQSAPHRLDADRWFTWFVLAGVAIALVGVAVGGRDGSAWTMPLRDLRGTLLKFYPFRLADVFIPLALSLTIARWLTAGRPAGGEAARTGISQVWADAIAPREERTKPPDVSRWLAPASRRAITAVVTVAAFVASLLIASPDRNPSRMTPARLASWIDVSKWGRANTPHDAVFVVGPEGAWGFKWFAHRAEYVNYKDAPQDAASLLEWERRLGLLRRWWESSPTGRYSPADLRRLGEATEADYLVTFLDARRFAAKPVYNDGIHRVYRLSGESR